MEKLIITAAICGAEVTKKHNPAVPYTCLLYTSLRGIDAVVLFERLQNGLCLYGVQRVTHAESLLIELSSP